MQLKRRDWEKNTKYRVSLQLNTSGTTCYIFTWHGSSVGRVSALCTSGLQMNPQVRHILSWKSFPCSAFSRRAVVS